MFCPGGERPLTELSSRSVAVLTRATGSKFRGRQQPAGRSRRPTGSIRLSLVASRGKGGDYAHLDEDASRRGILEIVFLAKGVNG